MQIQSPTKKSYRLQYSGYQCLLCFKGSCLYASFCSLRWGERPDLQHPWMWKDWLTFRFWSCSTVALVRVVLMRTTGELAFQASTLQYRIHDSMVQHSRLCKSLTIANCSKSLIASWRHWQRISSALHSPAYSGRCRHRNLSWVSNEVCRSASMEWFQKCTRTMKRTLLDVM